jgi:predicted metal-dependent enzyme (double-stranded beta helix superfamily)
MTDLDVLVAGCERAVVEDDPIGAVREVLEQALRDWWLAERFRAPEPGARLVHRSPSLTVLDVVWPPLVRLPPHDHLMFAAIAVYGGREDNSFFRRAGAGLEPWGARQIGDGDVVVLGDQVIHSVHNPSSSTYTGAIHVYGGDLTGTAHSQWTEGDHVEGPYDFACMSRRVDRAEEQFRASR